VYKQDHNALVAACCKLV